MKPLVVFFVFVWVALGEIGLLRGAELRVGVFRQDATPPVGAPLAYDTMTWVDQTLSARGIVLLGAGQPIVLCSVDWIGIGNGAQDSWKRGIAEAIGTIPERVAIHTVHQHDAPSCDFTALALLQAHGVTDLPFDPVFARRTIADVADAVRRSVANARPLTHLGVGQATVERIASNRRILGEDGKVSVTRWTATRDPNVQAQPVGQIDPMIKLVSFWEEDTPLAVLSYYATHPQSHYRTGGANPDFPGLARSMRESETGGVPHIHFNGAGGDIGAGKWNDGSPENRVALAVRLADGARRAWESTERAPISIEDVHWRTLPVALPRSNALDLKALEAILANETQPMIDRREAAYHLAWAQRVQSGETIPVGRLRLNEVDILHLPGEAVISYQLEAQALAPDRFVAVAAYGDYGPGYICRAPQYLQGGYEASARASRVAAHAETVLLPIIEALLSENPSDSAP